MIANVMCKDHRIINRKYRRKNEKQLCRKCSKSLHDTISSSEKQTFYTLSQETHCNVGHNEAAEDTLQRMNL